MPPRLSETEQVEVVDDEGGREDERPADAEAAIEQGASDRVLDLPHHAAQRVPLPEEQDQRQAAGQDVGAALGGRRHDAREEPLEGRAGHDAVLHGEERQQAHVDKERRAQRSCGPRVEGLGHQDVAQESDGIEKRQEEGRVAANAVDQRDDSAHGCVCSS